MSGLYCYKRRPWVTLSSSRVARLTCKLSVQTFWLIVCSFHSGLPGLNKEKKIHTQLYSGFSCTMLVKGGCILRNYTGGASRTKEAPEMAEVKFWSVHKPWRRYHYVPVDFDSGYKKHFKNFCSIWNKWTCI